MNKRYLLAVLGLIVTTLANAQRPSTYDESDEKEKGGFNTNRIFIGGSLNVGFSSYSFQVGGAPEIGYSITNWLDAGLGFNLNYYSERADPYYNGGLRYHNFNYGGGPFFRVYPLPFIFLQGQFEHNWVKVNQKYMPDGPEATNTFTSNSFIAGVGYSQRIVGQSSFYTLLGIDLLKDKYSPYRDSYGAAYPIIRAGFNFYLKPSKK